MTESNVAIAPDSVATGAHNIRTITVTPNMDIANPTSEKQQVMTIADDAGAIIGSINGALFAHDQTTHRLLRALILRLDILNDAICKNYTPPDELYEEG